VLICLKKDPNRHFRYNMGVTCQRAALVLLAIGLVILLYRYVTYKPPELKSEGTRELVITGLDKKTTRTYSRRRTTHTYYYAYCKETDSGATHTQTITQREYSTLVKDRKYTCPMYSTQGGSIFISWGGITDPEKAAEEYYSRFPTGAMLYLKWFIMGFLGLGVILLIVGFIEIQRAVRLEEDNLTVVNGMLFMKGKTGSDGVKQTDLNDLFDSGGRKGH